MGNLNSIYYLSRKVFLEKTKIPENQLIENLKSCNLPQSLDLFEMKQLKLLTNFMQKCNPTLNINFEEKDFISDVKIDIEESLEAKINKKSSKRKIQNIVKKNKIILKEHQVEAKDAIIKELNINNRCQFISACGTGKTTTSQKTAEEYIQDLNNSIILILVPSLELLDQFHKSWKMNCDFEEHFKNEFLLCSKEELKRVNKQNFNDTKFIKKLHSESNEIDIYLKRNLAHKLIFSTYQSLPLLANSITIQNLKIDFCIFDEAHKTTGKWNSLFSYALYDENIKIDKRLFMTATQKTDIDSIYDVVSMDNETMYGKVAYCLNVGDAIKRGIIKDYKIIVTKISSTIKNEYDFRSILSECILKIMNNKQLTKGLLFNATINDSLEIKKYINYKESKKEDKFKAYHVDGYLNMKTRKEIIQKLSKDDEKVIVTNSKLFGEGIDIPAIELVGFLNRTKSMIDVAQRLGRVQRKRFEDDNEPGYLFIPLFEDTYSIISDYYSGDWDYLIDILLAFKEMDNRFNTAFYDLVSSNDSRSFFNQVEIINFNENKEIEQKDIKLIQENIVSKIKHEVINKRSESWDVHLNRYKDFLLKNKRMPKSTSKDSNEKFLALWHQGQAKKKTKNLLDDYKLEKLNELIPLGFNWDKFDMQWNLKFEAFKEFYILNKKEPQSYGYSSKNIKLSKEQQNESLIAKWLTHQKINYKNKKLDKQRYELLKPYIKNWKTKTEILWDQQYKKYKDFMQKNSNRFPMDNDEERAIYMWISKQKKKFIAKELNEIHIQKLNKISDEWLYDGKDRIWKEQYRKLIAFIKTNNRLPVFSMNATKKDNDEHNIYLWYRKQKNSSSTNALKDWQNELFNKILLK